MCRIKIMNYINKWGMDRYDVIIFIKCKYLYLKVNDRFCE